MRRPLLPPTVRCSPSSPELSIGSVAPVARALADPACKLRREVVVDLSAARWRRGSDLRGAVGRRPGPDVGGAEHAAGLGDRGHDLGLEPLVQRESGYEAALAAETFAAYRSENKGYGGGGSS